MTSLEDDLNTFRVFKAPSPRATEPQAAAAGENEDEDKGETATDEPPVQSPIDLTTLARNVYDLMRNEARLAHERGARRGHL